MCAKSSDILSEGTLHRQLQLSMDFLGQRGGERKRLAGEVEMRRRQGEGVTREGGSEDVVVVGS